MVDITVNDNRFFLRKIEEKDLDLIYSWRNSEQISKHMFKKNISWLEHLNWFQKLYSNERKSTAFIFQYNNIPLGVINFHQAEEDDIYYWGLYLGDRTIKKSGIVLGYLGLNYTFVFLNATILKADIFSANKRSILFHEKVGFEKIGEYKKRIENKNKCLFNYVYNREKWLEENKKIYKNIVELYKQ